ncbi:hypothetical protein Zmor_016065 [Zophobas morio]|uniref:Uncharacterized protein n=1 Tax=Zophobas morio TaxID=2755281 RepID=A0AA38II30_9CUCU|nr:hypothetical protein Zmor_016065 [Zophobas morio]
MKYLTVRGQDNSVWVHKECEDNCRHYFTMKKSIFSEGTVKFEFFYKSPAQYINLKLRQTFLRGTNFIKETTTPLPSGVAEFDFRNVHSVSVILPPDSAALDTTFSEDVVLVLEILDTKFILCEVIFFLKN